MKESTKRAAAIRYEEGKPAPVVIAKGSGYVADNILEEAKKTNVPVYKDEKLATLLTEIELGEQIPEALYDVVAQILVFVTDLDKLYGKIKQHDE